MARFAHIAADATEIAKFWETHFDQIYSALDALKEITAGIWILGTERKPPKFCLDSIHEPRYGLVKKLSEGKREVWVSIHRNAETNQLLIKVTAARSGYAGIRKQKQDFFVDPRVGDIEGQLTIALTNAYNELLN